MKVKAKEVERQFEVQLTETELRLIYHGLLSLPNNPQLTTDGRLIEWMADMRDDLLEQIRDLSIALP